MSEVDDLMADLATYMAITTDQANEIERLRDALRRISRMHPSNHDAGDIAREALRND